MISFHPKCRQRLFLFFFLNIPTNWYPLTNGTSIGLQLPLFAQKGRTSLFLILCVVPSPTSFWARGGDWERKKQNNTSHYIILHCLAHLKILVLNVSAMTIVVTYIHLGERLIQQSLYNSIIISLFSKCLDSS